MVDHQSTYQVKRAKPWGEEIVFTFPESDYTGKIIRVLAGQRLSLQYHDQKQETLCLLSGEAVLYLEEDREMITINMEKEVGYTIKPYQKHRLEATTDCLLVEASTALKGKTYRLEDDHQRGDENLNKPS